MADETVNGTADGRVDEVLERLHLAADEFGPGLTNHGPMTVEALARLGEVDRVGPWVREYERRLEPAGEPAPPPIEGDWRDELRRVVPGLAAGAAGAAGHGAIRTAHAVALLEAADTVPRRVELARALRYWERSYQEVVPGPALPGPARSVPAAMRRLPSSPPSGGRRRLIADELRDLPPVPTFDGAPIPSIVEAAADIIVASRPASTVALVHAVTTPVALEVLAPYLPAGVAERQAWLVAAALVCAYGDTTAPIPDDAGVDAETAIALAVETGDEHAIKLAATGVAPAVVAEVARRLRRPPA